LWEEFNQQNSLPVPEHGAHDFSGRQNLFGGQLLWRGHTKSCALLRQVPQ
jgi:hypothetical protein